MEIKEILDYFGFSPEEVKNIDEFKNKFTEKGYIIKSEASKVPEIIKSVSGKVLGSATTKIKQIAKEFDIDFEGDEIKDKKLEEVIDIFSSKLKSNIEKINSMKESPNDDVIREYTEKINKYKNELKDHKEMINGLKVKLQETEQDKKNTIKNFIKQNAHKDAWSNINFSDTVDELKKIGFQKHLEDNFLIDIDEETNSVLVLDKKQGKRIENPNKAGEFLGIEDLYKIEAEKFKLIKQNNVQNVQKPFVFAAEVKKEEVLQSKLPYSQRN